MNLRHSSFLLSVVLIAGPTVAAAATAPAEAAPAEAAPASSRPAAHDSARRLDQLASAAGTSAQPPADSIISTSLVDAAANPTSPRPSETGTTASRPTATAPLSLPFFLLFRLPDNT